MCSTSLIASTSHHATSVPAATCNTNYEGHSINMLQNDITLLIFKLWKFGNICFAVNWIRDIYWNFYVDDIITETSVVLKIQSVGAVCCPTVSFFNPPSVRQHCELQQEVKVIWQKAPHGGPIPRLGVTPGGQNLYHWIPGVGVPISVP